MTSTDQRAAVGVVLAGVLVVALLGGAPAYAEDAPSTPALDAIAAVVNDEIAARRVAGAVVLVGQAGRVVYEHAFGDRAREPVSLPMTLDTMFDLASLTKVVATTTAVMQLVERGRIDLDAPAARYWPAFAAHGKAKVTIRELLTHRSGLRADLDLRARWSGYEGALAEIVAEPPVASPGGRFLYSDVNFAVLGEIVHRVTGQALDAYCAAHVFAPLGMRDTEFLPSADRHDRIAPTSREGDVLLWGVVHDPTARRMGGVGGHAGLFATARDLAIFAQMMLDGGTSGGARVLERRSIALMTTAQPPLGARPRRGLGWDLDAPGVPDWGALFSDRAYGHTGYTGTSLWIDPATNAYVILLTNRVHPDDTGDVRPLRARIASLVAPALASGVGVAPVDARIASTGRAHVETGLDVLAADGFAPLAGRRVGLITNRSGRDAGGRSTIEVLGGAPGVTLAALFAPEHGLDGAAERPVPSRFDPMLLLPVHSLYGETTRPTPTMLDGIDAIVFDVQDAGVRFYTYETTLGYAMEAAAARHIAFYVLDRPNPINAAVVQGPMLDDDLRSFTAYHRLPVRHGMTIGELATLFNEERRIGAELHVVPMRGYVRSRWYDETGLTWIPPSPNLRTVDAAALYPAVGIVEGANVSVGRGTASPFEVLGAPWVNGPALAVYLTRRRIPGVQFEATTFVPERDAYAGRRCQGVRVRVIDRDRLDAPALGIEIASALHRLHPGIFKLRATLGMIGARSVLDAIDHGEEPREIVRRWQAELRAFDARRERFLLYREGAASDDSTTSVFAKPGSYGSTRIRSLTD